MIRLLLSLLTLILNVLFDTPHAPESRPDFAELCWNETTAWIEVAGPTSYVCDRTGNIMIEVTL